MKNKKIKRILIIGSMIGLMSMTACGTTQEPEVTEEVTEEVVEEAPEEVTEEVEEELAEFTITFKNAANEDIIAKEGSQVTLPEFEHARFDEKFEGYYIEPNQAEVIEEKEDGTYVVKIIEIAATGNYVTCYSYDEETKDLKAMFVYKPFYTDGTEYEPNCDDFGMNVLCEKGEDGNFYFKSFIDQSGQEVKDIPFYMGTVTGWSIVANAKEADFEFGDEIKVSQDLELYPVVEGQADENSDFTKGFWVMSYGNTPTCVREYKGVAEENLGWHVDKTGKIVNKDETKELDLEKKEIKEHKPEDRKPAEEQKSQKRKDVDENGNPYGPDNTDMSSLPHDDASDWQDNSDWSDEDIRIGKELRFGK